ncbi:hypothetical protein MLD38_008080 [Melastoma candidum]|uniref:Uncharacterized protein n=1 Tax=Melastoma candidum TaxID=119954 RepID=A0ACB9RUH7_9MYRT|nr:hypothetical protein MLD38_008080 [Melastoma candidum]
MAPSPPPPPSTNWLSFSLTPSFEMFSSSSSSSSSSSQSPPPALSNPYFLLPPFDPPPPPLLLDYSYSPACWDNPKHHFLFTDLGVVDEAEEQHGADHHLHPPKLFPPSSFLTNPSPVLYPKLEDFLNCSSSFTPAYDLRDIAAAAAVTEGFPTAASLPLDSMSKADEPSCSLNASSSSLTNTGSLTLGVRNPTQDDNSKAVVVVSGGGGGGGVGTGKRTGDSFGQRTSIYRGVTRHRWTGRYEAHLWDNSCRREGQARKGRQAQLILRLVFFCMKPGAMLRCCRLETCFVKNGAAVYLGGYDKEDKAARAYDLAALKYWGPTATTNFPVSTYSRELEEMKLVTKQEFIASLRRKSSGFSRGASVYRGVTRHHQQGRWQARIGRVAGNKDLYLGTFATEEEAAEAYDIAAIKFRGLNAVTNFEMSRYDMEAIARSSLPVGGAAKRLKLESDLKPSVTSEQLSQSGIVGGNSSNTGLSLVHPFSVPIPSRKPFEMSPSVYHPSFFHQLQQQSGNSIYPSGMVATIPAPATASSLTHAADFFLWPNQSY